MRSFDLSASALLTVCSTRFASWLCRVLACLCLAGIGGAAVAPTGVQAQDTLAVDALLDTGDAADDGACDDGSGNCTLRAAIQEANRDTDQDRITFEKLSIDNQADTIALGSTLQVTAPIDIDATTAAGYSVPGPPSIVLINDGMGANADALDVGPGATNSTIRALNIVGMNGAGIGIGADAVEVTLCYLGVQRDGTTAQGNQVGVEIRSGARSVAIGGAEEEGVLGPSGKATSPASTYRNVIGGNLASGIEIRGDNNEVANALIGVGSDSTTAVANADHGVFVTGRDNAIGIVTSSPFSSTAKQVGDIVGNTISGNGEAGVRLAGKLNNVQGNKIGTDVKGTQAVSNNADGVQVLSDSNGIVNENVISGNDGSGIVVGNSATSADAIAIAANNIGLDAEFQSALPNGDGSSTSGGVVCRRSTDIGSDFVSTIGANVIAGNEGQGISLTGNCRGWDITDNHIGTTPEGASSLGNTGNGIRLAGGGASIGAVRIGYGRFESISDGSNGNIIAHNISNGVLVGSSSSSTDVTGVSVRGNAIYQNDEFGVDLGADGITNNDTRDIDDGPNRLQNHPEIKSADYDTTNNDVTVTYLVPSDPTASGSGTSYYGQNGVKVDFYKADVTGSEGKAYLGTDTYTESDYNTSTSGPDQKTVTFTPSDSVTRSDDLLAVAVDASSNTSEFSAQATPLPVELVAFDATPSGDQAVQLTWTTASETNNAGFALQHKAGPQDPWTKVGFVDSKAAGGTTTETVHYRFRAENLSVGTHRFRLKQRDLDGTTTVHDPVTVDLQMQEALQLGVPAPNPVQGQSTLSFAVKDEVEATITLYNTLGQQVQTVYRGTPTAGEVQTVRLSTDGLSSGVYFLRMQAAGQSKTQRVTVVQ